MSEVNVCLLVLHVDALVLPYNPAPCTAARLIAVGRIITRADEIPGHGGLHYRREVAAHGDSAPGSIAWESHRGARIAVAVVFLRHGIGYCIEAVEPVVAQMRSAVIAVDPGFGEEHPAVIANSEQTGEGVATAVLRDGVHRRIGRVDLLIRRTGALPVLHSRALWRKESGGATRKTES